MKISGQSPPFGFLSAEQLTAQSAPLSLERQELGHIVNGDQNVLTAVNLHCGEDDLEVIPAESTEPSVQIVEAVSLAFADFSKSLQDWSCALISPSDEARQVGVIVAADLQTGARLLFDLNAPVAVHGQNRSVLADESGLLGEAVDKRLNLVPGAARRSRLKHSTSYQRYHRVPHTEFRAPPVNLRA